MDQNNQQNNQQKSQNSQNSQKENKIEITFDKELSNLIKISEEILEFKAKNEILYNDTQLKRLRKYKKCNERSEESDREDHGWIFKDLFERYKSKIILEYNGEWLRKANIILQYGANRNVKNDLKFPLSYIFRAAIEISENSKRILKNVPDDIYVKHIEIIYPEIFLLHLYRIFRIICNIKIGNRIYIATDSEIKKLKNICLELSKKVGISEENKVNQSNNNINGLFNLATNIMRNIGIDVPEDATKNIDLDKTLGNVLNDPNTKNIITNLMGKIQKNNNIQDIVKDIASELDDDNLLESIKDTIDLQEKKEIKEIKENIEKKEIKENIEKKNIEEIIENIDEPEFID